jgi:hypothetical protein
MGGVFSRPTGFSTLGSLWGPFLFHAVFMAMGTALIGRALVTGRTKKGVKALEKRV